MTTILSRKRLLAHAAAVTGGAIVTGGIVASAAAAPVELPFYLLDPDCCHGCNACHKHAYNTLFASAAAADLFRAHPYCKCTVVEGSAMLPYDTWVALFGAPAVIARQSVDRRTQWVSDVLAAASLPPVPSPPAPSTPPSPPAPTAEQVALGRSPSDAGTHAAAVQFAVRSIRVGKVKRALALRIRLSTPSTVEARLVGLRGRILVLRNFDAGSGKSLHTLPVPNGVRPGHYRVAVVLRGQDGSKSTLLRTVVIK